MGLTSGSSNFALNHIYGLIFNQVRVVFKINRYMGKVLFCFVLFFLWYFVLNFNLLMSIIKKVMPQFPSKPVCLFVLLFDTSI